jgi:outer membrane lipoprotein carrier protein
MFAKAFIVAASFLVEQRSPTPRAPGLAVAPKAPPAVTAPAGTPPAPAPLADPVHIGPAGMPAAPGLAAGPTADELVAKVQAFYQNTGRFTAKFRQDYTNKAGFPSPPKDGKIYVKKPGKMRWDYKGKSSPIRSSYLTDGSNAWLVEYDNHQYGKQKLTENTAPVAITFLSGKGDLRTEFKAEVDRNSQYGGKTDYVLKLTPKKPSAQFKILYLVVDPGNYRVKQSIVVEGNGNVNHFMFYEPDFAKDLPDSLFWVNEGELKKAGWRQLAKEPAPAPENP